MRRAFCAHQRAVAGARMTSHTDPTAEPDARLPFDPERAPIVGIASEPAIPADRLTVERLRAAFVAPRVWRPEVSDESRKPRLRSGATGPVPASVLIPVVARSAGMTVLLTERTAHLHDHAGQVSFPGGSAESHDVDEIDSALRESEEEIGLGRRHVEVIGRLPDYPTITGFMVAPIVALVLPPFDLTLDDFEVAEVFEVPLSFLMNPAHHERREIVFDEGVRHFIAMPHGDHFIWGATAAMLRNLYHFLHAQLID